MSSLQRHALRTLVVDGGRPSTPAAGTKVWNLNLDQIESDTGRVIAKQMIPVEKLGSSTYPFEAGTVLYSKLRPYLNKVVVVNDAGVATTELVPLRCNPDRLLPQYLAYFLRSSEFLGFANTVVAGAKMPRMVMGEFWEYKVPTPSIPEQRRIVAILDQADVLRAKRREALAQLDELQRGIFIEMFGDPVANPKSLKKASLGSLLKLKSGEFLPASAMVSGGDYPVFGGNGVNGYHDEFLFDIQKIVIGRVGVYCGCVHVTPPKSWITDNALYVSQHDPALEFDFLAFALKQAKLNQYASQSAQPLISGTRIYPVEIPVPPAEEQREFVARTRKVSELVQDNIESSKCLDALFSSLQHRAFRGEL